MNRSPLTAHLRVYDTGHSRVAVYYIDILDEQQFVGIWKRAHVGPFARQFAQLQDFDAYAVEFVWLRATVAST
ncbi:MAG: hypothetical protein ISR77_36740 [Pirellulaceae bacterium]|nr:hypothetical protein [Pirellulaceae bacterium]